MKNKISDYIIPLMQNILKISTLQARFPLRPASPLYLQRDDW
jgi:hypothetical protein